MLGPLDAGHCKFFFTVRWGGGAPGVFYNPTEKGHPLSESLPSTCRREQGGGVGAVGRNDAFKSSVVLRDVCNVT